MTRLWVISAPSGAGKTTLCQKLLKEVPNLTLSISSTTRPPRGKERHGEDYFFLSPAEFESGIQQGLFAEWALVHGNYYGTPKTALEAALAAGKTVILDIDVQGAASLKGSFGARCTTVFVGPPTLDELERRLRKRGTDSEKTIQQRLANAQKEMLRKPEFDHVIINDDFERAYTQLRQLIAAVGNPDG